MTTRLLIWLLFGCALAWPRALQAQEGAALRRFALVVASNDGGSARPRLKHAAADANAIRKVLVELGGVQEGDAVQLLEPDVEALRAAIAAIQARVAALPRQRTELVFYYSGHSDDQGLKLGSAQLGYRALRALLDAVQVDVRVAILDSCASGAFTREKGGVRRAPFLFDTASEVRGHAFLSSASEHEAAQESDRLGGSFFTHYLVSGLRGAADSSGDRKVTLTEAYQFAFDETLARTGQTQIGAQHAGFDIRLVGKGDLVLTDLRSTASELLVAPSVQGQLFVRDFAGALFVELDKQRGRSARLALPAARYTLELRRDGRLYTATVTTRAGYAPHVLEERDLTMVEGEAGRARGDLLHVPAAAALVPRVGTNRRFAGRAVENGLDVALVFDRPFALRGLQLSLIGGLVETRARGLQLAGMFTGTHTLEGVQLSFVLNQIAHEGRGVSVAAGNLALGSLSGAQLGLVGWADTLRGVQLAGLNSAGDVQGVQFGALNVATRRVQGLQLGLLNYADEADVAIGLLSITRQGGVHGVLSTSDAGLLTFGLRLDAKYNYNFVAVGVHPLGERHAGYSVGAGFGAKLPLYQLALWLDIDLGWHVVQAAGQWTRGVPNSLSQLRALLRFEFAKQLSVFLGPTFNVLLQLERTERTRLGFVWQARSVELDASARLVYWPGLSGGVQF